jgi:hypothetical protein
MVKDIVITSLTKYYFDSQIKEHEKERATRMARISIAHKVEEIFVSFMFVFFLYICLYSIESRSL